MNIKPPHGLGFEHHRDGIFKFMIGQKIVNGWHHYAEDFINVLICLDDFTIENGTLQIYNIENKTFDEYYNETKKNGTPILDDKYIKDDPIPLILKKGDAVIFNSKCVHFSKENKSQSTRIVYI